MLYLIKSGNFVKIGYAQNIQDRMRTYQVTNPNFKLLGIREGDKFTEGQYHYVFRNRFVQGEWFQIPDYILKYLITHHFTTNIYYNKTNPINRKNLSTQKESIKFVIPQDLYNLAKSLYTKIVVAKITQNVDNLTFTPQEECLLQKYDYYNPRLLEEN